MGVASESGRYEKEIEDAKGSVVVASHPVVARSDTGPDEEMGMNRAIIIGALGGLLFMLAAEVARWIGRKIRQM